MDLNDPKLWDNESYTIEQIVKQKGLPQAVRVYEGYCGSDETLNFSTGDYLALESIMTLERVAAKYVDQTGRGISAKFTIPIGYSGKVRLMYRHRVFRTVEELMRSFPRYAEVKKAMVVSGEDGSFELPLGSKVELEKLFKSKGLMCKYNDKSFLLSLEDKIEWSSVRDTNEYTLKQVVDRWAFPKFVEFLKSDEKVIFWNIEAAIDDIQKYSGFARLEKLEVQDVIVGHHKETDARLQTAERNHRTLVMLPLDSQEIKEIRVQLSIANDKLIYDTIAVRKIMDDDINGVAGCGLYSDIQYVQKNSLNTGEAVYEIPNDNPDPPTPPIPPKMYTLSKQEFNSTVDSENKARKIERTVSCPATSSTGELVENTMMSTSFPIPNYVIGDIGHFSRKDTSKSGADCRPKTRKQQHKKSKDEGDTDHDDLRKNKEILRNKSFNFDTVKKRLSGINLKAVANIFKRSSEGRHEITKVTEQRQTGATPTSNIYDAIDGGGEDSNAYEQLHNDGNSRQETNIPMLPSDRSAVSSRNTSNDVSESPITSYTTEEVVRSLRECRLESFANYCEKEKLNGNDLIRLSEIDLGKEPFNLTKLEIRKFQAFKKRGSPKLGEEDVVITHL